MIRIAIILTVWTAVAVPLGILIGMMIQTGKGDQ